MWSAGVPYKTLNIANGESLGSLVRPPKIVKFKFRNFWKARNFEISRISKILKI